MPSAQQSSSSSSEARVGFLRLLQLVLRLPAAVSAPQRVLFLAACAANAQALL